MRASERAQQNGFKPGTSAYNEEVKRILAPTKPHKPKSHSPSSPLSPLSPKSPLSLSSPSSCIGRLDGLNSKPELNGSLAIIKQVLPNEKILVIPIIASPPFKVSSTKITNVSIADIQVGGRKRKSRKNRYTKNSRRTKRTRRTRYSKRTKRTRRNK